MANYCSAGQIKQDIMVEMVRHQYPVMHIADLGVAATTVCNQANIGYSRSQDKYLIGYDVWNYPYSIYPCFEFNSAKDLLDVIVEDMFYNRLINKIILIELQRLQEARERRRKRYENIKELVDGAVRGSIHTDSGNIAG